MSFMLRLHIAMIILTGSAWGQFGENYKHEPINYGENESTDVIARLSERITAGDVELTPDPKTGYLRALLAALDVPQSSQTLVFSKTSFQNRLISPQSPRAIYFGDDVYIGYVPGGEVLELTGIDADHGPIFYTLAQPTDRPPSFQRRGDECLTCHGAENTARWPGNLVRSVFADARGNIVMNAGGFITTHDSPMSERWGGWFVTGTHGAQRHMGNAFASAEGELDLEEGANLVSLKWPLKVERYLTPHSDIVALMVIEHQTHMHNLIARANYRTRAALHSQQSVNAATGKPIDFVSETTRDLIHDAANELLEYMLFKNEMRLTAPINGTSQFAAEFSAKGPTDATGRSLRQLDLETQLFRYPCSYLIYSPAFDALPKDVLDVIYKRLWRIVSGRLGRRSWGMTREQRQAILDILLATKPGLPSDWQPTKVR